MAEKKVVRYKLVRHKWPDEIEAEKKAKRKKIMIVFLCVLCFFAGGIFVPKVFGEYQDENLEKLEHIYRLMKNEWYFGKDIENLEDILIEGAMNGLVDSGNDPHTIYMDKEYATKFNSSIEGSYVGIGIDYVTSENGYPFVIGVKDGSGADLADVQPFDEIRKIDGQDCYELDGKEISGLINNAGEDFVTVDILRGQEMIQLEVGKYIFNNSVSSKVIDEVGVIYIESFSETSGKDVGKHLEKLQAEGIDKLIIDLRGNGGGYLHAVTQIVSYFLPKDTVVFKEVFKNGKDQKVITESSLKRYEFNTITILVDNGTASASEVFTYALKHYLNAKVVGINTYGKGTVQVPVAFKDGSALKYTIAEWVGPDDTKINGVGIAPDVEVPAIDAMTVAYQQLEDEVIEIDQIHSAVRAAQIYLEFLGYYVDRNDGYFSYATQQAIFQYQMDNQLEITGKLDDKLITHMTRKTVTTYHKNVETKDAQLMKALEVAYE